MSEHNHHHHHHHHHAHPESGLGTAFFLNLAFTIIEIIGGFWTNSVAILSDALHDLGDSLSLGLAWYLHRVSGRKRDQQFSYGYKRFNILGALITGIILLMGSIFIISQAVPRLFHPETPDYKGMMALAVLGVLVNSAAAFRLRGDESLNSKMVSLHLLEDVLGWVAVLIGSIIMYFFDWPIIDPILSIGIALFILFNVFKSLKHSLQILLQAIPPNFDTADVRQKIVDRFSQVEDVHDIHIWTMDGEYHIMTLHIVLAEGTERGLDQLAVFKKAIRELFQELKIQHLTIELEVPEEECGLIDC